MSSLRDRTNRIKPKSRGKSLSFIGVLALLVLPVTVPQAIATPGDPTVGMYLDQPFVQGSYVGEDFASETTTTTFNDQSYGDTCRFDGGTIEPLYFSTPNCFVRNEINFGGASTTSSTPSVGQYPEPAYYGQVGSGGASIVFDTPQTYFGLWWSAGSVGNEVQVLNGSNIVASTSANDVASTLYSSADLNAQDGSHYATRFYTGNPEDWYTVGTPTDFSDQDSSATYQSYKSLAQEPFVYIHFIAAPGQTFDRVNLVAPGNGFEFDNFTTSTSTSIATSIPSRLVLQRQLYEPNYVDFNANGGTGALPRQYSIDSSSAYLQFFCLDPYTDPTRCISPPSTAYGTQGLGWNTQPDGSGTSYYFEDYQQYPFTESQTLYAQWQTTFSFVNLTNSEFNASNVWDYVDWDSQTASSTRNFADVTLPSPTRATQYLEGWYTFDSTTYEIVRAGSPGEVIPSSSYTSWDSNYFGRWLDKPTSSSVDAVTPQVLLVYPKANSVELPSLSLTGDVSATICIVESDSSGNEVSSNLSFTDLATSSSGFSSGFSIWSAGSLLSNTSRYVRVTVSLSSDTSCSSGNTHVIELRPIGANLTEYLPLNLTQR